MMALLCVLGRLFGGLRVLGLDAAMLERRRFADRTAGRRSTGRPRVWLVACQPGARHLRRADHRAIRDARGPLIHFLLVVASPRTGAPAGSRPWDCGFPDAVDPPRRYRRVELNPPQTLRRVYKGICLIGGSAEMPHPGDLERRFTLEVRYKDCPGTAFTSGARRRRFWHCQSLQSCQFLASGATSFLCSSRWSHFSSYGV